MNRFAIKFNQLNFTFKSKPILQNFNLQIPTNTTTVIFGKSGTGKSTLLQLLLGFYQPQSGKIIVNRQTLNSRTVWHIRQQIAYLDQTATLGPNEATPQQLLREYFNFKANSHLSYSSSQLNSLLHQLQLPQQLLTQPLHQLSGGERQRFGLIFALLLDRPILLLDELTSALDPQTKQAVVNLILQLQHKTILLVTHDQIWKQQTKIKLYNFERQQWEQ